MYCGCLYLSREVSGHGAARLVLLVTVSHHGAHLLLQQLGEVLAEPLLVVLQRLGLPLGPPLLDIVVTALVLEQTQGLLAHHEVGVRIILIVV